MSDIRGDTYSGMAAVCRPGGYACYVGKPSLVTHPRTQLPKKIGHYAITATPNRRKKADSQPAQREREREREREKDKKSTN